MKAGALAQEDLSATVTRDKQRKMKVTVTRDKGTKAPKVQDDGKPLFVAPNIEWQQRGAGGIAAKTTTKASDGGGVYWGT